MPTITFGFVLYILTADKRSVWLVGYYIYIFVASVCVSATACFRVGTSIAASKRIQTALTKLKQESVGQFSPSGTVDHEVINLVSSSVHAKISQNNKK